MHFTLDYTERATLRDGTAVRLRLVAPEDKALLARGFDGWSERSRYSRFLTPKRSLTDAELTYLTDVDQDQHFALGAVSEVGDGAGEPIGLGIARFIRFTENPDHAEAAIAVADDMQGKGLGRLLFVRLVAAAAERGIVSFRCEVLGSNESMRDLIRGVSPDHEVAIHDGVMTIDLPIPGSVSPTKPPGEPVEEGPMYRLFKLAAKFWPLSVVFLFACNAILGIDDFAVHADGAVGDGVVDAIDPVVDVSIQTCTPMSFGDESAITTPAIDGGPPSYTTTIARDTAAFRSTGAIAVGAPDGGSYTDAIFDLGATAYIAPHIAPQNGQLFVRAELAMTGTSTIMISGRDAQNLWTMPLAISLAGTPLDQLTPGTPTATTPRRMFAERNGVLYELVETDAMARAWTVAKTFDGGDFMLAEVHDPQLSPDGLRLVVVGRKTAVDPRTVLYFARLSIDAQFGVAEELYTPAGAGVLSNPFLAADCSLLYVSRDQVVFRLGSP